MSNIVKTSTLVRSQIPEWIRDDPNYDAFVEFLQAYYQWMEKSGNVLDFSKNIPSYMDIDSTTSQFMEYFSNDFLQYFPQDTLINKSKTLKLAKELYQSKGVPSAFKFLFKILYDSDFDVEYNKDFVFRASAGTWFSVKSVRLQTTDPNFLNINNYKLFGEISKSFAVVENSVRSGDKTEAFISDIERLFQSGETVTVVDINNNPVEVDGKILSAVLVGQISEITIDPNNRGLLYRVGDPVVIYGGLNTNIKNAQGASAVIGSTTTGSIQNINVDNGGAGYTYPNTKINIINGNGAQAVLASIDPDPTNTSIIDVATDTIVFKQGIKLGASNFHFANIANANASTKLIDALTFTQIETHPISSILLLDGGSSLYVVPPITATACYLGDNDVQENLYNIGILGPIKVLNGGTGYQINDIIQFVGGRGAGANAKVTNVATNGAITSASYIPSEGYKLGGMGYTRESVPSLIVNSANNQASNASLQISGILGDGAQLSATVNLVGSIGAITITDPGQDYISEPWISLKVQDILVSNTGYDLPPSVGSGIFHGGSDTSTGTLPIEGDIVFQGNSLESSSYKANVSSITLAIPDFDQSKSVYYLRVFDYNTKPDPNLPLCISNKNIVLRMANTGYAENNLYPGSPEYDSTGVKTYGNGKAKAKAKFLNGLTISRQEYLNSSGQPSSYSVLQSDIYNNFTYRLKVEKEIAKYRSVLMNLLHPSGMKVIGEYVMKSNDHFKMDMTQSTLQGKSLHNYTGYNQSSISMVTDFDNISNNIVSFNNLPEGTDLSQFIFVDQPNIQNTIIEITPTNGPNVISEIIGLDTVNNQITLATNTWLTYPNVAYVATTAGSNVININKITNSYDIINNGEYSNTQYPLKDIVYAGDFIKMESYPYPSGNLWIENGSFQLLTEDGILFKTETPIYTVTTVDYENGKIYLNVNLPKTSANTKMSVNRKMIAQTQVMLYGKIGIDYIPELTTENKLSISTEDGKIIIVD